jgi:putative transposase
MYEYRDMTPRQRAEVLAERNARGYPWHAPPHFPGEDAYMPSVACYERRATLRTRARLTELADVLVRDYGKG